MYLGVPVVSAQPGFSRGREHFDGAAAHLEHRHVERAAAQVEHADQLVHALRWGWRRRVSRSVANAKVIVVWWWW